nr:peptidyl-prolyl cis-trans isomerase A1-like isoform X2 [Ipomoea batatas]
MAIPFASVSNVGLSGQGNLSPIKAKESFELFMLISEASEIYIGKTQQQLCYLPSPHRVYFPAPCGCQNPQIFWFRIMPAVNSLPFKPLLRSAL